MSNPSAKPISPIHDLPAVNSRDQQPVSEPDTAYPLLPAADFRSYAIATHFPRKLIKQLPPGSCQRHEQPGIYTLRAGTREVRLIVINALRDLPHNAPWRLFCSNKAQQRAALQQYHPTQRDRPTPLQLPRPPPARRRHHGPYL